MSSHALSDNRQRRRLAVVLLPIVLFAGLAGLFFSVLTGERDPSQIPSVLINKPVPQFNLPPLQGLTGRNGAVPGLSSADLANGHVTLVNIWASWCAPCREEHPQLMALSQMDNVRLVGINYKDDAENARRFLGTLGLPYSAIGVDSGGRTFVDWGAYGVPETFLVDGEGIIRYKYIGPISAEALQSTVLPKLKEIEAEAG